MKYSKGIFSVIILIFLVSLLFLFNGEYIHNKRVLDYDTGDVDGDGEEELVILTRGVLKRYGKEVIIYSSEDIAIYRKDFSDLNPWKITIGDIDGDGINEISIGVYTETIFHPIMDKRPFIYSFKDNEIYPKWRGSRLSRPFTDYLFYDIDKDGLDEIISIEILENSEKIINTYKWKSFGFEGFSQSESFKDINNLHLVEGLVYIDVTDENDNYIGLLGYVDGYIIIERRDLDEN